MTCGKDTSLYVNNIPAQVSLQNGPVENSCQKDVVDEVVNLIKSIAPTNKL